MNTKNKEIEEIEAINSSLDSTCELIANGILEDKYKIELIDLISDIQYKLDNL